MKKPKILVLTLSLMLGFVLAGCAPRSQAKPPSEESGQSKVLEEPFAADTLWQGATFTDVPVPASFRMIAEDSYIYSTEGGFRLAEVKYEGEIKIPEIIRLYQEQMPANGWTFKQISGVKEKALKYRKGSEECTITLKAKGEKTFIMVMLHPRR